MTVGIKVDLAATMKQAEDDGKLSSGATLKLVNGENRMRVVQGFLAHEDSYKGQRNFKWLVRVIDRKDGKVKTFFMPHVIYKVLVAFQQNPEYSFDEIPMPYDISVNAENAGTKEAKYSVIASRKNTPITDEEFAMVREQDSLEDLQKALYAKKGTAPAPIGTVRHDDGDDSDSVPF